MQPQDELFSLPLCYGPSHIDFFSPWLISGFSSKPTNSPVAMPQFQLKGKGKEKARFQGTNKFKFSNLPLRQVPPVPREPTQRAPPPIGKKALPKLVCTFCKQNDESEEVYSTHVLKDSNGIVVCPILRNLKCTLCGYPGGDRAHTKRHCPLYPDPEAKLRKSFATRLKEKVNSAGKLRRY